MKISKTLVLAVIATAAGTAFGGPPEPWRLRCYPVITLQNQNLNPTKWKIETEWQRQLWRDLERAKEETSQDLRKSDRSAAQPVAAPPSPTVIRCTDGTRSGRSSGGTQGATKTGSE